MEILKWMLAAPLVIGMALGPATPYVFGALAIVFGIGVGVGAYFW